ncbi:MAG: hypothetical protein DDT39_01627 [Firmicutes bacterium]|nr:hypothetical protein [candidate division NPL-UPA2 bacterium]
MPKASIFYFSGTGNTWWVANELAAALSQRHIEASAYSIEQIVAGRAAELVAASDLVGFGYPIYGSDLPLPMQRFIAEIEVHHVKTAFVFCTQWLWSGDGASLGASLLRARGFGVRWGEHFHMPSNVSVPVLPWPLHTDAPLAKAKYLRHSAFRVQRLAAHIALGRPFYRGFNTLSTVAGLLQRVPYRRHLHQFRDALAPDPARCTRCALCVRLCPADNLLVEHDTIRTVGRCVLCLRCYSFCPEYAILYCGRAHRHGPPFRGPSLEFNPLALIGPHKRF